MKSAILFVRGTYSQADLPFYKKLCRSSLKVAVDGGYAFFKKAKITPDLLIGDMDSATGLPKRLPPQMALITFPTRKDKTDSQLALEYCIDQGAKEIDLVMPSVGEIDHYFGNVFLLTGRKVEKWAASGGRIRIVTAQFELFYVRNRSLELHNCAGDVVSVLPLSTRVKLSCKGTEYDIKEATVSKGHSRPMRNRVKAKRAVFVVKGEALIFHLFGRRR